MRNKILTIEVALRYLSVAKFMTSLTNKDPSPTGTTQRMSPKFMNTFIIIEILKNNLTISAVLWNDD